MIPVHLLNVGADSRKFLESKSNLSRSGCWDKDVPRYRQICIAGKNYRAHRVAWTLCHGQVPDGLYVCHKCNNKACINPDHLYLGTHSENIRDAWRDGLHPGNGGIAAGPTLENAMKTHCIHGHELTEDNIYHPPRFPNSRYCRKCRKKYLRDRDTRRVMARRQAALGVGK